jgi:hypothetical protein
MTWRFSCGAGAQSIGARHRLIGSPKKQNALSEGPKRRIDQRNLNPSG